MTAAMLERPVDIMLDIRGEAELRAGFQHTGETVEIGIAHETALPVAALVPWIGIEKIDPRKRSIRQPVQNRRRVLIIKAQIGARRLIKRCQHLGHAIDEGFYADEAGLRITAALMMEVLAPAKADFHSHRLDRSLKQAAQILWRRRGEVKFQARQQILEQIALVRTERLAVAAAEKFPAARMG